jgi:hypothetical protein
MIAFHDPSRRSFLRIGSLGLGGSVFSLPHYLAAKTVAPHLLRDRSVVFLFMHGGTSQTETFEPKMDQPAGIRSATGEIPTSLPGVTFGATFPKLARLAHKLAIVRNFRTGTGAHDIKPIVGKNSLGANLGSLYVRAAGTNHPNGIPRNIALYPKAVDPAAMPMTKTFGDCPCRARRLYLPCCRRKVVRRNFRYPSRSLSVAILLRQNNMKPTAA